MIKYYTIKIIERKDATVKVERKLARSSIDRVSFGVLGGIAQFFGWNARLLRIIFLCITLFTFNFYLVGLYIVAIILMPDERH
ncbi:PspC domain-containing protein [Terribacillus sp. AE2B 122]|uniref:PspC domain-containing protein n=1 Tax=Terribacillus sp. AE2B 122 TaxID=1331902 RepID=UPI0015831B38